ncbi:MAG: M23 family metallopeptidase [Candidatus Dependentiae bacterium]|nr:M23 family metallopeptidase [Candidatus Dependentiae bacterium]
MTLSFSLFRNPIRCMRLFVGAALMLLIVSFWSYRRLRCRLGFATPTVLMRMALAREQECVVEPVFDPVNRSREYLERVCRIDRIDGLVAVGMHALQEKKRQLARKKARARERARRQRLARLQLHRRRTHAPPSPAVIAPYIGRFVLPIRRDQYYISSPFGWRRRTRSFHKGIDMCACRGTPVMAAADGVVVFAGNAGGFGNLVIIEHDEHCRTRYGHLSAIKTCVGAQVPAGKIIGLVGATGHVVKRRGGDGSHLHFGVYIDGHPVNPFHLLR